MIGVGNSRGFTIIETIIFLTVSSALFVSAMLLVGGQQAKTEFRQAVGEAQSVIDDTANNVSTGYYKSPDTTGQCAASGSGEPGLSGAATVETGANPACMMLGQVIQFGQGDNLTVSSVIGFRSRGIHPNTRLPQDLTTSSTTGAYATVLNHADFIENVKLPFGLTVARAIAEWDDMNKQDIRGVAFVSSLGNLSGDPLQPGSLSVDVVPLPGTLLPAGNALFRTEANATLRATPLAKNPSGGVRICLDSGGTNQHIVLSFGANGNLATSVAYRNGLSAANTMECGTL